MKSTNQGYKKIFKDCFVQKTGPSKLSRKKGRSNDLIIKRNECLISRYLFYGFSTDKRYEKIIEDLSSEFFLSSVTIVELITDHHELLVAKKNEFKEIPVNKLKKQMATKWPHLEW